MNKKCTTFVKEPLKRGEVGNVHLIQSFNETGQIEFEIYDKRYTPHTIWIDPSCVTRSLK